MLDLLVRIVTALECRVQGYWLDSGHRVPTSAQPTARPCPTCQALPGGAVPAPRFGHPAASHPAGCGVAGGDCRG